MADGRTCFKKNACLYVSLVLLVWIQNFISASDKARLFGTDGFNSLAFDVNSKYFIMFYAPWCGHCKRMQTVWDKLAEQTHTRGEQVTIGKVDCTVDTPVCAGENIKAYPTLRLFIGSDKYTYRGNRKLADLNKFVESRGPADKERVPDQVQPDADTTEAIKLTDDTFESTIQADGITFVDFFAPWCPHCRELTPTWNQLASHYRVSQVTIAKVDCTSEPNLCRRHQITAYPSLKLYAKGYFREDYRGARSFDSLVAFVDKHSQKLTTKPASQSKEQERMYVKPARPRHEESGDDYDGYPALSQQEWENFVSAQETWLTWTTFHQLRVIQPMLVFFHSDVDDKSVRNLRTYREFVGQLKATNLRVLPAMVDCLVEKELCQVFNVDEYRVYLMIDRMTSALYAKKMIRIPELMQWVEIKLIGYPKKDEL